MGAFRFFSRLRDLLDVDKASLVSGRYLRVKSDGKIEGSEVAPGGGDGAVDSVNGQTGVVVLNAGHVGADPAGSAATVQDDLDTHKTQPHPTSGQLSKLDGIEVGATADQTGVEIKAAYESQSNTNAFTDAEKAKVANVPANTTSELAAKETPAGAQAKVDTHAGNTANPHSVTKAQVGLGNVDNTSDANKPVSSAQQTALNGKQATLVSGTNIKTVNGNSLLGSGNITITGDSGGEANPDPVTQVEAEAGTETALRSWSPLRVAQAIAALADRAWTSLTGNITLSQLNTAVSDATLIDTGDSRLSDARTPTAHTHLEEDITDLDKYTQVQVDAAIASAIAALPKARDPALIGASGVLPDAFSDSIRLSGNVTYKNGTTPKILFDDNPDSTINLTLSIASTTLGVFEITAAGAVTWTQDVGISADTNFDEGDIVEVEGPATADPTFSSPRITIPLLAR